MKTGHKQPRQPLSIGSLSLLDSSRLGAETVRSLFEGEPTDIDYHTRCTTSIPKLSNLGTRYPVPQDYFELTKPPKSLEKNHAGLQERARRIFS